MIQILNYQIVKEVKAIFLNKINLVLKENYRRKDRVLKLINLKKNKDPVIIKRDKESMLKQKANLIELF